MARKRKNSSAALLSEISSPPADLLSVEVSEESTRKFLWALMTVNCALVVCDFVFNYGQVFEAPQLRRLFNIAREDSLANWISSLETLLVAMALAMTGFFAQRAGHAKNSVRAWAGFAAFFLFLAADDGAKIHERVGPVARDLANRLPASQGSWYNSFFDWVGGYSWHATVLPVFLVVGVALFNFAWRRLHTSQLRGVMLAAFALLAVAVGLDYFEGWFRNQAGDSFGGWERYTISHFQKTLEEFLEMTASCLLFYVYATHALSLFKTAEFHAIAPTPRSSARNRR